MRITVSGLVLLAHALCAAPAQGAEGQPSNFSEEMSRQQNIYQGGDAKAASGYVTDRSLDFYAYTLPAEFGQVLPRLGLGDGWMDIGAGQGQAIVDYFTPGYVSKYLQGRPGGKARVVAISMEDRRTPAWHEAAASLGAGRMQYLYDKPLRDYSTAQLGRFQVITDMFGGFSYTEELSVFLQKTLDFLELNGVYYSLLQDVKLEDGRNPPFYTGTPYLTQLSKADGSEVKVCEWLKRISCVQVSCEARADWKPPIEVYRVQKTCAKVEVPVLQRTHFKAGTPPERRFVFKE